MTEKLYDYDSYLKEFDAVVLKCEKKDDKFVTVLDKTAFFPEEGGQCADSGTINGIEINYVEIKEDIIYHYSNTPFNAGDRVHGEIDFKIRFRNMQNHSGEHIISGIANRLFGYENVGFHLGKDNVTMDLNGPLNEEDIIKIELLANEAVYKNMQIKACYPEKDVLEQMDYRSKGEILGKVRIVEIGDLDKCACCAPHVNKTGEIGIIKILDFVKYKGGTRLSIACGLDALSDYMAKHTANAEISRLLSVKQEETLSGVKKLMDSINTLNMKLSRKTRTLASYLVDSIEYKDKTICLFIDDMDMGNLRLVANDLKEKTDEFAVLLSGNDDEGYKYVIISKDKNAEEFTKNANSALSGRGGGRGNMTSGTFMATKEEIENFFSACR